MNLSKSKYTLGITCEKKLWLSCYKNEEAEETTDIYLKNGTVVGSFARNLFGDYTLIEFNTDFKGLKNVTVSYNHYYNNEHVDNLHKLN